MSYKNKTVWIIGASSGIGKALATELSKRGAKLVLSARSKDKLEKLSDDLKGDHQVIDFDASNEKAVDAAVKKAGDNNKHIDSIIMLAAIYDPMPTDELDLKKTKKIIDINLGGTFNLVHYALPLLKAQGGGQLALCGSVAGYSGLPKGQPYSATKAAIINLAESMRAELGPEGIDVRVINPGFVKTQLTDKNDFEMPFIIEPGEAANSIADGLQSSAFDINFPKKLTWPLK
ncbi:MAG: SDR family NAD(P)-dependent oxidoreductase, partial [Litorimonas sp.]